MEKKLSFTAGSDLHGERIDTAISRLYPDITRSSLKSRGAEAFIDGIPRRFSHKLREGEKVECVIPPDEDMSLHAQKIDFDIIYHDRHIAVINKPAGLPVHPSKGHSDHTLVNGLIHRFGNLSTGGDPFRPGIVHRLDMDTAGVMVVALTDEAHRRLVDSFKAREVKKLYLAVTKGHITPETGVIDLPVGRSSRNRKKMAAYPKGAPNAKPAHTEYRVVEYLQNHSLVEINIHTGRTHQIRVHLSHINHPVAGDPVYSRGSGGYGGMALFAKRLEFKHPVSGEMMEFETEMPAGFAKLLAGLRG
jgi:23S rRNA pseudouridine1911/1915/1917 synthase